MLFSFWYHALPNARSVSSSTLSQVSRKRKLPDLSGLLSCRERGVAESLDAKYRQRFGAEPSQDRDLVYHLGDSAERCNWSAVSKAIPTVRKSHGILWSPKRRRFLTGRELLATLGFPVTADTAASMLVPPLPVTDTKRAASIAGNCMHWSTAGIVQLVALSCFKPP